MLRFDDAAHGLAQAQVAYHAVLANQDHRDIFRGADVTDLHCRGIVDLAGNDKLSLLNFSNVNIDVVGDFHVDRFTSHVVGIHF